MKTIIKKILQINWLAFIRINCSKRIHKSKKCFIFPYWGSTIRISKTSSVILNQNLNFGIHSLFATTKKSVLILENNATLIITGQVNINRGSIVRVEDGGRLEMGQSSISEDLFLDAKSNITIGDGFLCSRRVTIRDNDGHNLISNNNPNISKSIFIGDNVWVCQEAMILKGVSIGDGSVIGAKTIITKDVSSKVVCVTKSSQYEIPNSSWQR